MRIDYNGAVIPWYERPLAGGFNYTWEEKPVAPPVPEIQQYIANETYIQEKMREGNSGIGGILTNVVNPILDPMAADPIKTAAMLAASVFAPELIPLIAGADTAIAGGSPEDVLKSAATAYVGQQIGTAIGGAIGGDGFSGVTETGLPTVAGESVASDLAGTTLLGDAGATGAYETAIDAFPTLTDQVVSTPDISTLPTDDATRLAQLIREFENPTELTGPTIDTAGRATVTLEDSVIDSQAPIMPSNLQDTAYLDPGLIDVAPENVTIGTPDTPTYYDASPTFPVLNVSPEYDPSAYLPTNLSGTQDLGGFDNIPSNLGTNIGSGTQDLGGLNVPFNTTTDLSAGELTVTGDRPYVPFEENFPLPYEPFEENFPIQEEVKPDTTAKTNSIKLGNLLKSSLQQSALTQQKLNLSNALRGSQMPQTLLPSIYKQANPFNFGQQNQPVQDTNALAKLLRTA